MVNAQPSTQLSHHLIAEMRSIFSDYGLWDFEPSYHMIKQKKGHSISNLCICRNFLSPFCKLIDNYDDVTMPLAEVGLQCIKSIPHLEKGPIPMTGCKGAGWVHFLG